MVSKTEHLTTFDRALFDTAAAEGLRQGRSARQQLEQWARLGAALSAQLKLPSSRVRLALEGVVAQRNLSRDEARQFDAVLAVRIDDAVTQGDFASAPLPDFTTVTPDPHRVLAEVASRAHLGARSRELLREALTELGEALDDEHQPTETGR